MNKTLGFVALISFFTLVSCGSNNSMPQSNTPPVIPVPHLDESTAIQDTEMKSDTMMEKTPNKQWTKEELGAMEDKDPENIQEMTAEKATGAMMKKEGYASMMKNEEVKSDAMMIKKETGYKEYSESIMDNALKSGQKVVLFFHATWCPSCRALDSSIKSDLSKIPADTLMLMTDYDSETALKQKYGVTVQHTTVVLKSDGSLAKKTIGPKNLQEVLE